MSQAFETLTVRPYQLMFIVCKIGAGLDPDLGDERLTEILRKAREDPLTPISLRCNVDSLYRYQNPGRGADTAESEYVNDKRDLDILQRLGMAPGDTRPAIALFGRLLKQVETAKGICGFERSDSDTWKSSSGVTCEDYEKGRAMGLGAIIPPRSEEEMARVKEESAEATYQAEKLLIRPHHTMCMSCFYGRRVGNSQELAPIAADNLYEAIVAVQKNPEIPITLIAGPCMICPPCHNYDPKTGLCIDGTSMGLRDQKKDLDFLQRLDLKYGDTLPARTLFKMLYDRIHSTVEICGYCDGIVRAPEWRVCGGPEGDAGYVKAREDGLGIPGLYLSPSLP